MKILFVEDNKSFAHAAKERLEAFGFEVIRAESKATAEVALNDDWYDLILCDLKIPSRDDALDLSTEHGIALFQSQSTYDHGTPVVILSGWTTVEILEEALEKARHEDYLGRGSPVPLLRSFQKKDFDRCVDRLQELGEAIRTLDALPLSYGLENLDLPKHQSRVLRIFASRHGGSHCQLGELRGGLTSQRTLRMTVEDQHGEVTQIVVAKIGPLSNVRDEKARYDRYVPGVLPFGSYAPHVGDVMAGAGDTGGVFYRLAEPDAVDLFTVLRAGGDGKAEVGRLEGSLGPWQGASTRETLQLSDVRKLLIADEDFVEVSDAYGPFDDLEALSVQANVCTQHADFHGANVLVGNAGPIMIDYGSITRAPASLDPVTLELSYLFHPSSPRNASWPDEEACSEWADLSIYLDGSPVPEFVTACREWAHHVTASDAEVLACAYAVAVRQLKYDKTPKDLAQAVIDGIRRRMQA